MRSGHLFSARPLLTASGSAVVVTAPAPPAFLSWLQPAAPSPGHSTHEV